MLKRLLVLAVLSGSMLIGCSEKSREEVSTSLDSTASSIGRATEDALDTIGKKLGDIGSDSTSGAQSAKQEIAVTLSDFKINMPMDLKAGQTRFNIVNTGKYDHNFELEGQGKHDKLMANLEPGGKTHLDVDLKPGTYKVYCPVGNHESRGMTHTVTVK